MTERIEQIRQYAAAAHSGQVDQQGAPYILHLNAVCAGVETEAEKVVALLHDAIEDGAATRAQLAELLTADELTAVELLTRCETDTYEQFIERVATAAGTAGEIARAVKLADVRHNYGRLTPALERLRGRYEAALERLATEEVAAA
jgi:(p)ppGpp synthase/HD superfamily hydrolase